MHTDFSVEQLIISLQDWWETAGVDLDFSEDMEALTAPLIPNQQNLIREEIAAQVLEKATQSINSAQPPKSQINTDYPDTLKEFQLWLSKPDNLIEGRWAQKFASSHGVINPEIMIVSAMPDQNDGQIFSLLNQKLMENMTCAIGCDSPKLFFAPLASACPAEGRIDPNYNLALKHRMEHMFGLVRPRRIIFLGDALANIFFEQDLLSARQNKLIINHLSAQIEAIVTFHPRILIERPEYKAEAWKDLQMLTRITESEV